MRQPKPFDQLEADRVVEGMFVFFPSSRSFRTDDLRRFLREESKAFPKLRELLGGSGARLLDELALFLDFSGIVRSTKFGDGNLVVSESGRAHKREILQFDGTLPAHEEFLKGLAERFELQLSGDRPAPKVSEHDKQMAQRIIDSAKEIGEMHRRGTLHPGMRSSTCDKCQGLLMTEDLVEEHMQAHAILGE